MPSYFNIKIVDRCPTVGEYQSLRDSTEWVKVTDEQVALSLTNTLFAASAFSDNILVGMGRVVGDMGLYFYIQDIIVLPAFKGKGIGKKIMTALEGFIEKNAKGPVFVGLMAAKDVKEFYEKRGYQVRVDGAPGMFKYMNT